jgi:hypothetical protein
MQASSRHFQMVTKVKETGIDMGTEQWIALTEFVFLFGAAGYFVWLPVRRLQSWNHNEHRH